MRKLTGILLLAAAGIITGGCAAYHPNPLTEESVNSALQVPDVSVLTLSIDSLQQHVQNPIAIDLSDGLSPDEAAVIALLENPGLKAMRDQRGLADAQLLQARILPDPSIDASLDVPVGGTRDGAATGKAIGIGWDAGSLITRPARVREAKYNRDSIQLDIAWQEWQVAQSARIGVYRLATLQRQCELARETDENLKENAAAVQKALMEGVMTELNFSAAEAASNQAHSQYLSLMREASQQQYQLLRVIGLPEDSPLQLEPDAEAPDSLLPLSIDSLKSGLLSRRLDLIALRRGYDAQEERVRAAILEQFPGIQIGMNKATDTGNLISTGGGISINLPLFDRNRGQIAVERATRQMLFDEFTARVHEAHSDIASLHDVILSLNEQINTAENSIPNLERLVNAYRQALREHQADILSYYTAWNDLTNKRIELLSLRQELVEARIALEIAAGIFQQDRVKSFITLPATREGLQ